MTALNYNFDSRIKQSILKLREQKHQAGFPFMIEVEGELPARQVYMEYANGTIEIVEFDSLFQDYYIIRKLTKDEALELTSKIHLKNA